MAGVLQLSASSALLPLVCSLKRGIMAYTPINEPLYPASIGSSIGIMPSYKVVNDWREHFGACSGKAARALDARFARMIRKGKKVKERPFAEATKENPPDARQR